jgi:hypothetical protein
MTDQLSRKKVRTCEVWANHLSFHKYNRFHTVFVGGLLRRRFILREGASWSATRALPAA